MAISILDLAPRYQQQALKKLQAQESIKAIKKQKYNNEETDVATIRFKSKKEAKRYVELMAELAAGRITDLKLQEEFLLQGAYTTPEGKRIRSIKYLADFTYYRDGIKIVEDVKSQPTRTDKYIIKKKMMQERLKIEIQEV